MSQINGAKCVRRFALRSTALTAAYLGVMTMLCSGQAIAQAQVETVTVTAEKRSENIQNVPLSVSAISGDALEKKNIVKMTDLAVQVPNLKITESNNVRDSSITIRNIGSSGTNAGIEPSVGVFVDGVYIPAGGAVEGNLLDIASVEVLRGPQGTLYGRNTPVGALNITTRAPTEDFEAMADVDFGNDGQRRFSGYVGGAIGDNLAGRLSLFDEANDGHEYNLDSGSRVNDRRQYGARGRIRWTPSDNTTVDLVGFYTKLASHCCIADIIDPTGVGGIATPGFLAVMAAAGTPFKNYNDHDHKVDSFALPDNDSVIAGGSVALNQVLPFGATLVSITGYNVFEDNLHQQPGISLPVDVGISSQGIREDSYSEELRLVSPTGGFFEYVVGLYGFYEDNTFNSGFIQHAGANRVYPGGPSMQNKPGDGSSFHFHQLTDSAAAFGQVKLNLTDKLHLIGGLRYSYDKKNASLSSSDLPGSSPHFVATNPEYNIPGLHRSGTKLTYLTTVQYNFTDDIMAYANMATGYKDGGFNARNAGPGFPFAFGPENSTNYEVGAKTTLFDHRLTLNGDVFRMLLHGFQQSVYDAFLTPPGFIVGNAGTLKVDGFEFEANARPVDALSLTATMGYADETISDYSEGTCPSYPGPFKPIKNTTPAGTCNYDGLTPGYSPKLRMSLDGEWEQPMEKWPSLYWFVGGTVAYTSSQYLDPTLDPRSYQPSVTTLDARLGVQGSSGWRIMLYGRNLTDEVYYNSTTTLPQAANISGGGTNPARGYVGWYAPPRTYGIEASIKF